MIADRGKLMAKHKPAYETALDHLDISPLSDTAAPFHLSLLRDRSCITIRVRPDDTKLVQALKSIKLTLPKPLAKTGSLASTMMLWIAPDEYLLISSHRNKGNWLERLDKALKKSFSAVIDSSGTFTLLNIGGDQLIPTLQKLVNYDLQSKFPVAKVISTAADAAPVILVRLSPESILVLVRFSYSAYLYQALEQAAREYIQAKTT